MAASEEHEQVRLGEDGQAFPVGEEGPVLQAVGEARIGGRLEVFGGDAARFRSSKRRAGARWVSRRAAMARRTVARRRGP